MKIIKFKNEWLSWLIILASLALSFWAYPQLPEQVISHWNFQGQADAWSSREFHSLFFPALLIVLYFAFLLMPLLDPKKDRYKEFARPYLIIRQVMLFVFFCVFTVATLANLNYQINVGASISGLIGALMIFLGSYFNKLKRNWFIGIRTPWTLSSENVWDKTHRVGGRLFIILGVGIIIIPWIEPSLAIGFLLASLICIIIGINIYSYLLYRKEDKKNHP